MLIELQKGVTFDGGMDLASVLQVSSFIVAYAVWILEEVMNVKTQSIKKLGK